MKDRNEESLSGGKQGNIILCCNCGLPARPGDAKCMYCKFSLDSSYKPGFFEKLRIYFQRRKWNKRFDVRKKGNIKNPNKLCVSKRIYLYVLGSALTALGVFMLLFVDVLGSVQAFFLAVFLLLYGIFSIAATYKNSN